MWGNGSAKPVWAEVGIIIHAGIAQADRGCERPLSEEIGWLRVPTSPAGRTIPRLGRS